MTDIMNYTHEPFCFSQESYRGETNDIARGREAYLTDLESRRYSPATLASYRNRLKHFAAFLAKAGVNRLAEVTREHLRDYRRTLAQSGMTAGTVANHLGGVRRLFAFLEQQDRIFLDPAAGLAIPSARPAFQPTPSAAEVKRLLSQPGIQTRVGLRDRALLETAYTAGVRLGELSGLQMADLDLTAGILRIKGKGNRERAVPLGRQALFFLSRYRDEVRPAWIQKPEEPALFLSSHTGGRLSESRIRHLTHAYGLAAGIKTPISIHALRRACATHLFQHGAHPLAIQAILGHAGLKTLGRYLRTTITELQKMHAGSKMGQ